MDDYNPFCAYFFCTFFLHIVLLVRIVRFFAIFSLVLLLFFLFLITSSYFQLESNSRSKVNVTVGGVKRMFLALITLNKVKETDFKRKSNQPNRFWCFVLCKKNSFVE